MITVNVLRMESACAERSQEVNWVRVKTEAMDVDISLFFPTPEGAQLVADAINKAVAK